MSHSPSLRMKSALILALVATSLTGTAVLAAKPAPKPSAADLIKTRQAGFKKMGGAMKALGEQLKSPAPAQPVMVTAAMTIAATAREQGRLFPAGSGSAPGVKTEALPAIWTNNAEFQSQMSKLVTESAKLVTATNGGDVAAIRLQARATGAVCGSCHHQFRKDDD